VHRMNPSTIAGVLRASRRGSTVTGTGSVRSRSSSRGGQSQSHSQRHLRAHSHSSATASTLHRRRSWGIPLTDDITGGGSDAGLAELGLELDTPRGYFSDGGPVTERRKSQTGTHFV
jgi:hypothetical protein